MSKLKLALLGSAALAAAASWGVYEVNFKHRPQLAFLEDGSAVRMRAPDMEFCFEAKQKSWSMPEARAAWAGCREHLERYGALEEFNTDFAVTHWFGLGAFAAAATLFWAAMRETPPPRHKRGPRLLPERAV